MRSAAGLALALCFSPAQAKAKAKDLPSFLFMLGDDIGWADMGYAGGECSVLPQRRASSSCFFFALLR